MIGRDDIRKILDRPGRNVESVRAWCRRNDVDEFVMGQLAAVYGFNQRTAAVAIDAFRLGHEARREDEPKAKAFPSQDGRQYAVEFVVVDRDSGRIVGGPSPAQDDAEGLAGAYNEIAQQPSR